MGRYSKDSSIVFRRVKKFLSSIVAHETRGGGGGTKTLDMKTSEAERAFFVGRQSHLYLNLIGHVDEGC